MTDRRILFASYHFPPDPAVGGLRIAKLARSLRDFGWTVEALTPRDELRPDGVDWSRLEGLDGIRVTKTREFPRLAESLWRLRAATRGSARRALPAGPAGEHRRDREPLERRVTRYVMSLLWYLPDEKKNWAIYAAATAVRMVRRRRLDWVFTSGPPFSTHVIGLAAKRLTPARWIADFRDPWIEILDERNPSIRSPLSDGLERRMEAAVITNADYITTTTMALQRAMQQRYPESAHKIVCVPNGVDARMLTTESSSPFPVFTITYAGALYYRRSPEPLFAAVRQLLQSGRVSDVEIRIKFVGDCELVDGVPTRAVAERFGLGEIVQLEPRLPHADAMDLMRRSQLLLVLAPHAHRLVLPAKIFDYIACGRPILAIADPGPTADLIAETGCGACFSAGETDGMAAYIESALRGRAQAADHRLLLEHYGMPRLAGRLADLMTKAAHPVPETVAERA